MTSNYGTDIQERTFSSVKQLNSLVGWTQVISVLSFLLLVYILQIMKEKRTETAFKKQFGCGDPIKLKYKWPFALDLVLGAFENIRNKQALQWFKPRFERTSTTFEQRVQRSRSINTIEPANIESILNSNFSAYGLGKRRATFYPLLGDGIFTQEGTSWKHSRELLRPLFSFTHSGFGSHMEHLTEEFIDSIPGDKFVDLQPLFF